MQDNQFPILSATVVVDKDSTGYKVYLLGNKNICGFGSTKREAIGDFVINYNLINN